MLDCADLKFCLNILIDNLQSDSANKKARARDLALTSRGKSMDDRFESVHEVIEALRGVNDPSKRRMLQAVSHFCGQCGFP